MSLTLIEQVNKFTTVVVEVVTLSQYIKPYVRIHEYTGPARFVEAFIRVAKAGKEEAITIHGKYKCSWNDGFSTDELTHKEFATLTAVSLMREAIPAFVKGVCNFSEGNLNGDNSETVITASVDTYGNFAEGHRYWQNLVAQETEIEASKAEAERIAKEIIEAKSTGKSMESFGSGDSIV
jgi:hypothetical protein